MNDASIEIIIDLVTNTPEDAINQDELLYIYEELEPKGAKLIPLESEELEEFKNYTKKSDLSILIGAVHIVIPSTVIIAVLVSFIKKYFDTCKSKQLRIKKTDGSSIEISGYSGKETEDILKMFVKSD
jgi:hypothetical protein